MNGGYAILVLLLIYLYLQCRKKVVVLDGDVATTKAKMASACKSKLSGMEAKLAICNSRIDTEKLETEMMRTQNNANKNLLASAEAEIAQLRSDNLAVVKSYQSKLDSNMDMVKSRIDKSLNERRKKQLVILTDALKKYDEVVVNYAAPSSKDIALSKTRLIKTELLKAL